MSDPFDMTAEERVCLWAVADEAKVLMHEMHRYKLTGQGKRGYEAALVRMCKALDALDHYRPAQKAEAAE